jgi:transposase
VTETCDDDASNLITHVATTPATTADCDMTAAIHTDLAAKELLPSEHYLDIGYIDAELLVRSQIDHQVMLVGPVSSDPALTSAYSEWNHTRAIWS